MKHHQQSKQNSTTNKRMKQGQDSKEPDSFNIDSSKNAAEQSKDAKTKVFYRIIMAVAFIIMIFVVCSFMASEGEKSLIKEAKISKYTIDKHFALFTIHFNRSYPTEEHKSIKMAVYHQNHNELIKRNLKNMGITDGAHFHFDDSVNRQLTEADLTTETISQGITWTKLQEAYNVGCEGLVWCFLLAVNSNFDETTEEFFRPRRNNATVQFEFYLSLTGNPSSSVDWMQYKTYVKNQGATTTCYLQVYATVGEMLMTKRLREVPQNKRPALIAEMKKWSKDPSLEISWPDHCVLDPNIYIICAVLDAGLYRDWDGYADHSEYESLKRLTHTPKARTFNQRSMLFQTCTTQEELESNDLYLDITSKNYQDDLDQFFSNDAALKNKYVDAVCSSDGKYHGQSNRHSPLTIIQNGALTQDGKSWVYVPGNNSIQLQLHLTFSPVTIVMYVCDPFDFKNFGIGVYRNSTKCNETVITHTAVVVGYGETEKGEEYWELLNSYGPEWGYQGTIRLARNTAWDQFGGQNGILIKPAWNLPVVRIDENGDYQWSEDYYYKEIGCKLLCAQLKNANSLYFSENCSQIWDKADYLPNYCNQYFW